MAVKKVKRPEIKGPNKINESMSQDKKESASASNQQAIKKPWGNDQDINELICYLSPTTQVYFRFLPSSKKIKALISMLPEKSSCSVLKTAFSLLVGKEGMFYFTAMLKVYDGTSSSRSLEMYQGAEEISETLIPEDVMNELQLLINVSNAEERGFLYNDRKKEYTFNANIFVKHFRKRCVACTTDDGKISIYNKKGFYEELSIIGLGKLIRLVMHEGLPNSWKSKEEGEVKNALLREIPIVKRMNEYRNFLNLKNGMLSLDTFELHSHNAKYFSTIQLPIDYDKEAEAPNFLKFMKEITLDDSSLIRVHQEIMGYLLTAETKAEKVFYYYGKGSNGKSVLATIITHLVGHVNVSNIPLAQFSQNFGLETIINKTVNIAAENEIGTLNTAMLKAIVSGDRININKKYHSHIDYQPFCKLLFLTNNLPNTTDLTNGYARRVMILPFNRKFEDWEQNVHLKNNLLLELSGILNWALIGLKRLQEKQYKFSFCQAIEDCQQKYLNEQNPVKQFIREHINCKVGVKTKKPDFYEAYISWLGSQELDEKGTRSRQLFWKYFKAAMEFENIPLIEKKVRGCKFYDGLEISGCPD